MYRGPASQEGPDQLGPGQQGGRSQLRSRGSCMFQAHMCHTAALSLGAGSCTARCGGHRLHAGSHPQSSGRGHRRGSHGNQGCTPGRWHLCSQGGSGTSCLHCRAGLRTPGGHSYRLGSQGSHGSQGDSGHSEGLQTRAGTGSGQPRRSPRAGSLQCCSHTADRAGSGSSQAHSGHTWLPQSLPGMCTGLSPGHSHHSPLRGWNTGRGGGSPGRRTLGHRTHSRCPGSWVCTGSVPTAGPSGRHCLRSRQRCNRSSQSLQPAVPGPRSCCGGRKWGGSLGSP